MAITVHAVALRRSHPHAPALDVLDLGFQGLQPGSVRFPAPSAPDDPLTGPRSAFGRLIVEAFDQVMTPDEWAGLTAPGVDPHQVAGLLQVWCVHVLPRFDARYSLQS